MRKVVAIVFAAALLVGVGCHSTPKTTSAELRAKHPDWPLTVDDAVTQILAKWSDADKAEFKAKKKDELIEYHMSLGLWIRNYYGLWNGNDSLLADCHADVPDGASMVIIEAIWKRLQAQ